MRNSLALAFVCFALPLSALARLGETEAEITKRYGQQSGEPSVAMRKHFAAADSVRQYVKSGLVVVVAIKEGKSVAEMYAREDRKELGLETLMALLEANKQQPKWTWTTADVGNGKNYWVRSDGQADAIETEDGTSLEILTDDFEEAMHAAHLTPVPSKPPEGF